MPLKLLHDVPVQTPYLPGLPPCQALPREGAQVAIAASTGKAAEDVAAEISKDGHDAVAI